MQLIRNSPIAWALALLAAMLGVALFLLEFDRGPNSSDVASSTGTSAESAPTPIAGASKGAEVALTPATNSESSDTPTGESGSTRSPDRWRGIEELESRKLSEAISISERTGNVAGGYVAEWMMSCWRNALSDDEMTTVADSPQRAWALEAIRASCEGVDVPLGNEQKRALLVKLEDAQLNETSKRLLDAGLKGDIAVVDHEVDQLISSSVDPSRIHAGLLMKEKFGTKLSESDALRAVHGDSAKTQKLIGLASRLLACERLGGCDAYHPLTLMYCLDNGCAPGSNLLAGIQSNLPEGERAALSMLVQQLRAPSR
jgi:hypothetical protein